MDRTVTLGDELKQAFGAERVGAMVPLAPLTTFKVGGPAEWMAEPRGIAELQRALEAARRAGAPVTVLGGGSNVLVSDRGVAGLVLRLRGGAIARVRDDLVRADAGVTLNALVRWTVSRGVSGLEAWAGTPGTVGGAVHGNAHFQGRLIGEMIDVVGLMARDGSLTEVPAADMEFGYDRSRLVRTGEIVAWADVRVGRGDPAALREVARESLRIRKLTQPLAVPSAGCVFQNPDPRRHELPAGVPPSAGALLDLAGMKGARVGRALVSPVHANFIVNTGGATAAEVRALIERCRRVVREQFGVTLREELIYLGEFDDAG